MSFRVLGSLTSTTTGSIRAMMNIQNISNGLNGNSEVRQLYTKQKFKPIKLSLEKGKTVFWCACGLSNKQPLCDGSHKTTNKTPVSFTADETKDYNFCLCKQTNNKPMCDGSHAKI